MGGDVWNHSADVLITPANNRLSGREGLDGMIHQKAGKELTQVTRNICLEMRKINAALRRRRRTLSSNRLPFPTTSPTSFTPLDPTADDPIRTRLDRNCFRNLRQFIHHHSGGGRCFIGRLTSDFHGRVCLPSPGRSTPDPPSSPRDDGRREDYGIRNYTIVVKKRTSSATCGPSTEKAKSVSWRGHDHAGLSSLSADRCGRVARSVERSLPLTLTSDALSRFRSTDSFIRFISLIRWARSLGRLTALRMLINHSSRRAAPHSATLNHSRGRCSGAGAETVFFPRLCATLGWSPDSMFQSGM